MLGREFDAILVGAFGDPRVAEQHPRQGNPARHALPDGPVRECASGAPARCRALPIERRRAEGRRFRRDPREHRGRVRRCWRRLQEGNGRRNCHPGRHQYAQGCRARHPLCLRLLREKYQAGRHQAQPRAHVRQVERHDPCRRPLATSLQGSSARVSADQAASTCTSTRSACRWCAIRGRST